MSQSDSSEDETELQTPRFLRKNSRFSVRRSTSSAGTPSSLVSSVMFGPISEDVVRVWSQLPEDIRLDPSLAAIQREYERITINVEKARSFNIPTNDSQIINLSVSTRQLIPCKTKKKGARDEEKIIDAQVHGWKLSPFYRYTKLFLLTCCWILFTLILMIKNERIPMMQEILVPRDQIISYPFVNCSTSSRVSVTIEGPFLPVLNDSLKSNLSINHLIVWIVNIENSSSNSYENVDYLSVFQNLTEQWIIPILPQNVIGLFPNRTVERIFDIKDFDLIDSKKTKSNLFINLVTDESSDLSIAIDYDFSPINTEDGVIYAAVVLLGLYILIIFEIVHRALAAMLASTMSLAILAAMNERPTMTELISWIDIDTLLLLFSMMILVAIFAETGIFDYLAVYAYKITGGKLWPLVNTLCFFTAFISSILDNVTTVLLMTPVTIRLCEVMQLNPVPILTAMVVYSNIGGATTPVGDPPNVIIASNRDVIEAGVGFSTFFMHMGVGVAIVFIVVYGQLRFIFRDVSVLGFDEPQDVQELRHEIAIWQRAAASLSSYSKDESLVRETLMKKIRRLVSLLKKKLKPGNVLLEKYQTTLEELQEKYPIRDKWLLVKSSVSLVFVITLFFLHNLPHLNLSLGWTALLGVLLLLVLADTEDIDGLLARVEWSTLLFFASLFILMEALARLGLIAWIGNLTEKLILTVHEESRLAVAILLILWISAFASAFVDNVPLATMMVRIATSLSKNDQLNLPLQPLIWALAFGACMGGNATLIGATANVVCAGVAEQHGYRFTFMQFFKVGFPIMLSSTATVTVYLMIAHVAFNWQ